MIICVDPVDHVDHVDHAPVSSLKPSASRTAKEVPLLYAVSGIYKSAVTNSNDFDVMI